MPESVEFELAGRRREVADLLCEAADRKLVFGNTEEAAKKARKAHDLAHRNPELDTLWKILSAYRLAHLALRTAKTREDLEDVDRFFAEAASGNLLGPLPQIYRLPVLHRLRSEFEQDSKGERIREAFRDTLESLRNWQASNGSGAEAWQRAQLQSGVFNMVELASYFLGMPYLPQLEGLGWNHPDSDNLTAFFPSNPARHWCLVGHEKRLKAVRYSKELALEELDSISQRYPEAILFKLSSEEGCIRRGAGEWMRESINGLKLLAVLLLGEVADRDDLRKKVMSIPRGGNTSPFRQMKRRLTVRLAELSGLPEQEIFLEDSAKGLPVVNREIPVYGAIEWRMFR